jgi:hypothetical protein
MAKVAPKLPVEGPEAYVNNASIDIPPFEMINQKSKLNLGRST